MDILIVWKYNSKGVVNMGKFLGIFVIIILLFWIGIICVAWHFISKFW